MTTQDGALHPVPDEYKTHELCSLAVSQEVESCVVVSDDNQVESTTYSCEELYKFLSSLPSGKTELEAESSPSCASGDEALNDLASIRQELINAQVGEDDFDRSQLALKDTRVAEHTANDTHHTFVQFLLHSEIRQMATDMAKQINEDYKNTDGLHIITVMDGGVFFSMLLGMQLERVEQMQFMKVKSYEGIKSTGHVEIIRDLLYDVEGKDVVLVEDIVDTGLTMNVLVEILKQRGAKSIKIATMLLKIDPFLSRHHMHVNYDYKDVRYIGKVIPNRWVSGFGLDLDGYMRNWPDIWMKIDNTKQHIKFFY